MSQENQCAQPAQALLPCPFCGSSASIEHDDSGWLHVACDSCGAEFGRDDDKAALTAQWNTRAIPAPEGAHAALLHRLDASIKWLRDGVLPQGNGVGLADLITIRAALAAPAPQAPAWQPIETAPKDGSRLILWWAGMTRVGRCAGVGAARDGGDWWQCPSLECTPTGRPTHWMPLPAAPQTKEPKA